MITAEGNRKKDAAHLDSRYQRNREQTKELENSWIKRENSDSIAKSINLGFTADPRIQSCNVYLLKRNYLQLLPIPLPSIYKGKSVMTLTRKNLWFSFSRKLLMWDLSWPTKANKSGCWTKSEQVLQNLIPPSNTDMQPFPIIDGQTALDPGLTGH